MLFASHYIQFWHLHGCIVQATSENIDNFMAGGISTYPTPCNFLGAHIQCEWWAVKGHFPRPSVHIYFLEEESKHVMFLL